jgi:Flp pilus assembly protein TadG
MLRHFQHEGFHSRFLRGKRGNAGVEFALLLPLMMILLFGGIEIGRVLHDYHVVNEAVRDAARYLSRVPTTCPGGALADGPVYTAAQHEQRAKALALTGTVDSTAPNLLGYWTDASTVTVSVYCIDNGGGAFAELQAWNGFVPHITLEAQVPFTFMFANLISPNATITIKLSHNVVSVGL